MSTQPSPLTMLPDWYPDWARRLAEMYFSGTTSLFVLHGNVHDVLRCPTPQGDVYCNLVEFLATQLFGSWQIVVQYDLAKGLRPLAGSSPERLQGMVQYLAARLGELSALPREPDRVLHLLDQLLERNLLEDDASRRRSIAVVLDHAQYLVPAGELGSFARAEASRLVRFLSWAQNPYIRRVNNAFCLITEKLNELNDRLVQNPHVGTIEIPLPDRTARSLYVRSYFHNPPRPAAAASEPPPHTSMPLEVPPDSEIDQWADMANGLTLVNLNVVLAQQSRRGGGVDLEQFRALKKSLLERQCQGLVEFVEPQYTLDLLVGHEEVKRQLREDAEWIARGQLDAAPMGYLICGPVGTGKTFLAECYAGEIGIPCVELRNFRSKYVGETEGNLEQVLTVLRSLGPVVVIIDEADAALGNRRAAGDSGTSSRVFSMIASQMGDTRYRGKIIWMLLTSRPDLLPIDLKRQGRAEVHIPLLYPHTESDIVAMFHAMAKKNRVRLADEALPPVSAEHRWSGADIESIVLAARRLARTSGRAELSRADLEQAVSEFIPSAQGLEKELQELAAVLECTQRRFLTPDWQQRLAAPDARTHLQERLVAIRQLLEE